MARQEEFLTRTDTVQRHDSSFESVREQLSRILGSPTFSNAPSLSRLLRHLVEHSFQGSTDQLKEYTLGVEVFDRGESFDPRSDTIVRVQARQLRSKLEEYYRAEGRADSIVIEVPKGHYVASFRPVPLAPSESGQHFPRSEVVSRDGIREVHSQILQPVPQSLPAPATPLIGREPELAAVKELLLREGVRLATLTGAGGSGKTRLGLQVVTDLVDKFPGGVYFIALASIADPDTVASTIAKVLGVRHTGGRSPVEAMQDHLRLLVHAPTLLLLDNFEHLLAAAPLPVKLLEACAQLKVLVTSRAVLHVYGEHEYPLPPLPLPEPEQLGSLQLLSKNPAITLFVDRANAVKAEFKLTEENARLITEICCRLDGLPLAIELAAARIKMLPPKALLERLENRLEILTGGARDLPARQQTLRNTIDWSHDLLSAAEQKLFRRLCVFAGGCTLEGIEAVCNTRLDLGVDVLDGMSSLVDKSLLQRVGAKEGESRFVMLQTLREYGLERLAESGEEEATRRAHAAYFLVLAEESKLPLTRPEWTNWLSLCDAEHDNLRAALDWLIASDKSEWALRLGLALNWFWELREHFVEGRERLEAILRKKGAQVRTKAWAKAAGHAGGLASVQGDYDGALRLHQEALDVYRELDDQIGIVKQLSSVGLQKHFQGDYVAARPWFEHCLQACRELGDRSEIAGALSNLADVVNAQGEHVLARSLLEEAMSISRELGDWIGVAWSLNHLGDVARDRGDLAEARRLYQEGADTFGRLGERWGMARSATDLGYLSCDQNDPATAESLFDEALKIFLELGHQRGIAKVLEGFAYVAARQNGSERALKLAGAASSLRQTIGAPPRLREQAKLNATLEPAWQHGDSGDAKAARASGWKMRLEEAIQYALDRPRSKPAMSTQS